MLCIFLGEKGRSIGLGPRAFCSGSKVLAIENRLAFFFGFPGAFLFAKKERLLPQAPIIPLDHGSHTKKANSAKNMKTVKTTTT